MYTNYPYAYSYTTYSMPLYLTFLPILALAVTVVGGLALYFLFARRPGRAHKPIKTNRFGQLPKKRFALSRVVNLDNANFLHLYVIIFTLIAFLS